MGRKIFLNKGYTCLGSKSILNTPLRIFRQAYNSFHRQFVQTINVLWSCGNIHVLGKYGKLKIDKMTIINCFKINQLID